MPLDLADDLERIARHIPCLEKAARDETALPYLRAAAAVELTDWRMALNLAGQDRTDPAVTSDPRTETNDEA